MRIRTPLWANNVWGDRFAIIEADMPKMLEQKLKKEAKKKGLSKKRTGAYVYGTLSKLKKKSR